MGEATATINGVPAQVVINTAPASDAVKPGYKTTEFWKSTMVNIFGMVVASGVIPSTGTWAQVVAFISVTLVTLGYQKTRADAKVA